jgi:DNA-directed RNA polymerase specialized sigma24 family protein
MSNWIPSGHRRPISGPTAFWRARGAQGGDDVVRLMPERTRTIFVLRRIEGMSYKDIAGRLGLSVSAVESI